MKKIIRILCIIIVLIGTKSLTTEAQENFWELEGRWIVPELDSSVVQILKIDNNFYTGVITYSKNQDHVGTEVLREIKFNNGDNLYSGTLYSPARNIKVNAKITKESDDKIKVEGRKLFIKKTYYWFRDL